MSVTLGSPAPDFTLPTDGGGEVTLSALKGRLVILYFYPRDNTPGCTKEACGFRDAFPDFGAIEATVIGISRDSVASHDRFKAGQNLPFTLASDAEAKVATAYGSWIEKTLYGKTSMGIDRSTFLIDRAGVVRGIWHKVKVPGHIEAVLAAAREIAG
jgi:thioredoxin-dependent peroxiredoxin